jgi:uncharacterized protein with gpF-like domain
VYFHFSLLCFVSFALASLSEALLPSRLITGLTPAREQAYQERMMLRIARSSEAPIRREVARAMRAIARDGEEAISTHEERMRNIITSMYTAAFNFFGDRMWQATQKANNPHEQKRDAVPLTPQFDLARRLWIVTSAAYKVTEIAGTTLSQAQKAIRQATAEAVELGLSEADTAALIQRRVGELGADLSRLRARVISRTESHAASNASTQMAAKASGLPMQKEWIASGGERTRETHLSAHGQKVGIDDPFTVGGSLLMQPGDVNAPAEEVINCRCVVGYSLP